ncbi:siderophore-iron reductase FhuF [Terrarubrum flagellatum]|uniref:siderophore-iron reductase FhuF n=1 Tax=Terrirubrum flagellatum TaxID=2895980 RepID=UPI0031451F37
MIASLAPCFVGNLACAEDSLALPGEHASSVSGRDLLYADTAKQILVRYGGFFGEADWRAVVSMWTQWHFGALIIPTTAAIVMLRRGLPVELDRIEIALHERGRTAAVIIPDEGKCFDDEAGRHFARLFDGHVEPLIDHFSRHLGVSQRLLWCNAAAIFEWTLRELREIDAPPAALQAGQDCLERRAGARGERNPMFAQVRYPIENGAPVRRRKLCCLRYLLPGVADCGDLCPLPLANRKPAAAMSGS